MRDLYNLSFITNKYYDQLSSETIFHARDVVENKGVEQLEYLINTQSDNLINNNKLENDFLKMYDKLGLIH
jgi:hypothetical protein